MMNFLLDPYILAIPSVNGEKIERYAENLYKWASEIKRNEHKYWTSSFIVYALTENEQYPSWDAIKKYMSYSQDVYSAYDVFRSIEKEIVSPPYLDDQFQMGPCEYELEETIVIPEQIEARLHEDVAESLRETLIIITIAKNIENNELANSILFGTSDIFDKSESISLETYVIKDDDDDIKELLSNWRIITSIEQLDELEGFLSFWKDTQRAVDWMYRELTRAESKPEPCPRVIASDGFHESICRHGFHKNPTMLEKIFRNIVLGLIGKIPRTSTKGTSHHALTDGPNGPQFVREIDKATAWRLYIQESNPGWRVHYWLRQDDTVELGKFCSHDDKNYF